MGVVLEVTNPIRRFPDVQKLIIADLEALAGTGHTGYVLPEDLGDQLTWVRVRRAGGPSDRLNDHATIDVDVFGSTYAETELLAERIRQRLVGPPPPIPLLDRIDCDSGPQELPWGDGSIRRWGATYTVVARRQTALI